MYTIIFDWKRTIYDPESKQLIEGAINILKFLTTKWSKVILIGKGGEAMLQEVKRLKVEQYFSKIIFLEGKKDMKVFSEFVSIKNPKLTMIVGDRIRSEIEIGNKLNATTIWIKQGKFSGELPVSKRQEPTFSVNSLADLVGFFASYCNRANSNNNKNNNKEKQ